MCDELGTRIIYFHELKFYIIKHKLLHLEFDIVNLVVDKS